MSKLKLNVGFIILSVVLYNYWILNTNMGAKILFVSLNTLPFYFPPAPHTFLSCQVVVTLFRFIVTYSVT
jgi:hypothetical protein